MYTHLLSIHLTLLKYITDGECLQKRLHRQNRAFKGLSEGRVTIDTSSGLPVGTYFYILNYTSVDNDGKLVTNEMDTYT
jgi:hypothetical protein